LPVITSIAFRAMRSEPHMGFEIVLKPQDHYSLKDDFSTPGSPRKIKPQKNPIKHQKIQNTCNCDALKALGNLFLYSNLPASS